LGSSNDVLPTPHEVQSADVRNIYPHASHTVHLCSIHNILTVYRVIQAIVEHI